MVYCFLFQGRNKSDSNLSRPSSEYRRGSQRGTPQPEDSSEDIPPREPTPVPTASVFMQAIDWLLEVKAVPVSRFIFHISCTFQFIYAVKPVSSGHSKKTKNWCSRSIFA